MKLWEKNCIFLELTENSENQKKTGTSPRIVAKIEKIMSEPEFCRKYIKYESRAIRI
jgi:hypothetical protein